MLFLVASALAGPPSGLVRFSGALYVAVDDELLRSTDGQSWLRVTPTEDGLPVPIADVAATADTLFVTTGAAVLRSADGNVWERRVEVLPEGDSLWADMAAGAQVVALLAADELDQRVSEDGGRTWRAMSESELARYDAQRTRFLAVSLDQAYFFAERQVRNLVGDTVVAQLPSMPLGIGVLGSTVAWWEREGVLVVRRGTTELRTVVEAGDGKEPEVLDVVEAGKDLLIGGPMGLWRLDPAGRFSQVHPLEGLPATTTWGPRAVVPVGEKVVPWDAVGATLTVPSAWRARADDLFSVARPQLYGAPATVDVERHMGMRCADVRAIPEGDAWDYVAFPPGLPEAWSAAPVVQVGRGPDWRLCVEQPGAAWSVRVHGADPATDTELATVLTSVATVIERAAVDEASVASLPVDDSDIGATAGLVLEPALGLGDPAQFHALALRLNTSFFGDPEDWFNVHLDAAVGATTDVPGFLYDFGLGIGAGHRISPGFTFGVYSGIGLDGSAPADPFALRAPVGAVLLLAPGGDVAFALRGEGRWWYATTRTQSAGPLGIDEVRATLDMAFGAGSDPGEGLGAAGFLVGLSWVHREDADSIGFRLGLGAVTNGR